MVDFPTFINAFFGALILGIGYVGLWFKYKIDNKNFYKLKTFDKTIQSLMIGVISSSLTLQFLNLNLENITNEQDFLIKLLQKFNVVLVLNFFIVFAIIIYWVILIQFAKRHLKINKARKTIKDFWKRKKDIKSSKV